MSITVAVRVRPFNQRELNLNTQLCVKMTQNQTILIGEGEPRVFAFDYSFWSHDDFKEEENGLMVPTSERYADQIHVYKEVGNQVLQNALDGYHCCLFAYGQTGAGKSYSMIGYGENKGIVPKISEEIFKLIERETSKKKWFEVNISMLEIYNEKIQDLLIPVDKRPLEGLKIRESKSIGVYVEALTKHPVQSYEQIEKKMALGSQHRTIASTLMNACSSRAHTIITIEFQQYEIINNKKVSRFSAINLVDLAGSEKFSKTGASGDRMKEGCSINKSLTVLGKVISNLADKSMGKGKNSVTPYRESSLTRILQNALGGNSKTLMICAISPSSNNYDETLSTLRYADQAKKIKCHAVINESEADKKIRELQKENDELKELLKKLQKGEIVGMKFENNNNSQEQEEEKKEQEDMLKKIKDLEETLKANNLVMEEYQKTFEERMQEEKDKGETQEKYDLSIPHLTNLNEDQMLCYKIYHNFENRQQIVIGRGSKEFKPDIKIIGIGMQEKHTIITKEGDSFFIQPGCEEATEFTCVNGNQLTAKTQLNNLDRIAIGFNTIFLFKNPLIPTPPFGFESEKDIDWEKAQLEISNKLLKVNINPEDNLKNQQKYIEIENHVKKIEEEYQDKIKQMQVEHDEKMKQIQEEMINNSMQNDLMEMERDNFEHYKQMFNEDYEKQIKVEIAKKDEFEKQYIKNFKENDKKKLEDKMSKINPNVIEANLIAQELGRNIVFKLLINFSYVDFEDINFHDKKNNVNAKVEVENNELGYSYQWDIDKFTLRYIMFRELLDQYYLTGELPQLDQQDDPFYDPRDPVVLGEGFVKLMSLAYLVDNPNELILVGDNGQVAQLTINLIPVDENGEELDEDHEIFEDFIDDPQDLFGKKVDFLVQITRIKLNIENYENIFVSYSLKLLSGDELQEQTFQTQTISGKNKEEDFKYKKQFCYANFQQNVLNYLLNSNLCFELQGTPTLKQVVEKPKKQPVQEKEKVEKKIPVTQKVDSKEQQKIKEYNEKIKQEKNKRMEEKKKKEKEKKNCQIF